MRPDWLKVTQPDRPNLPYIVVLAHDHEGSQALEERRAIYDWCYEHAFGRWQTGGGCRLTHELRLEFLDHAEATLAAFRWNGTVQRR